MVLLNLKKALEQPLGLFNNRIPNDETSVTNTEFCNIPTALHDWNDLPAIVQNFKNTRKSINTPYIYAELSHPPSRGWIFNEESDVQGILQNTLFAIIENIFSYSDFPVTIGANRQYLNSPHRGQRLLVAQPDRLAFRARTTRQDKNRLLAPIEIKKPLARDTDIRRLYEASETRAIRIIQQIVGYMYRNHVVYGIITSYQHTYVCHLNDDGSVLISQPFLYDSTNPGSIEVIWYILHKAMGAGPYDGVALLDGHPKPTEIFTDPDTPTTSIDINQITPENITQRKTLREPTKHKRTRIDQGHVGRKRVVIKTAKHKTHSGTILQHEINVYKHLENGKIKTIPERIASGIDKNHVYFITSYCGRPLNEIQITEKIKQAVLDAVDSIHDMSVCHNDLELRNILYHRGKISLCDFEISILQAGEKMMSQEREGIVFELDRAINKRNFG